MKAGMPIILNGESKTLSHLHPAFGIWITTDGDWVGAEPVLDVERYYASIEYKDFIRDKYKEIEQNLRVILLHYERENLETRTIEAVQKLIQQLKEEL